VLSYEETDPPEPADTEVLVRMGAASVNPADWKDRRGQLDRPLPRVLGFDGSGTVEVSRVAGIVEGDDVFGYTASGSYAELATASGGSIAKKPAGLSFEQAAAIPVAGLTAWQALFDKGGLESGQTVVITGAAGGVGHLAVQLAKRAGARVVGTGSSRNRDFVLGLGADEYVDYTSQDVAAAVSGADVALDCVGGDVPMTLLPTLREGGIIIVIASAPPVEAARERGVRAELHVTNPNPAQLTRVAELVAGGEVRLEIEQVLPIQEVALAHERSEAGHVRGKIVLRIEG
jgi:NADPH:quinone reductase-like Zn-dependent oxidoreductase